MTARGTLRGAVAAAITPLARGGDAVDLDAVAPYVDFLAGAGVDGVLALGTTGEGILLRTDERRQVARAFVAAARGRIAVAVHCGAQTTAETVALCADARDAGADAVAVIGPPYFPLDEPSLRAHFTAAAAACAPLPFYAYEFEARTGYALPVAMLEAMRATIPNFRGLKISVGSWERCAPYLLAGLDAFIGAEALIARGLAAGAKGSVSGLAAAFPERVVELVRAPTDEAAARVGALRASLQRLPFHAAAKATLARRGVPIREDVRAPLRGLTREERTALEAIWKSCGL